MKNSLSVVIATKNEEKNIARCLESVKEIADEIIVYDEFSSDKTVKIAKKFGARVYKYEHKKNFHETKQKAIDKASGSWILQLDADEVLTEQLKREISKLANLSQKDINEKYTDNKVRKLFKRHQEKILKREGKLGNSEGDINAFFIPRLNMFLGGPLKHAGVYPDGVIRLFRNGKAKLAGKSVHEVMEVDGAVSWLSSDLLHFDSPTFERYLERADRYTDITANELDKKFKSKTKYLHLLFYSTLLPLSIFLKLFVRHKGFLDGFRGFVWSLFSALHFPIAYFKFWQKYRS